MKATQLIPALLLLLPASVNAQLTGAYTELEVEKAGHLVGRVAGRVVFDGRVPEPLQLLITKDMEVCGEGYRERKEIDTTNEMGLRNVVVFIEKIDGGKPWPAMQPEASSTPGSINQKNCYFAPHVQVIRRGSEIDIINSDSTLHNIHAYELIGRARRSLFNISQPEMGPVPQMLIPKRGNRVSLECDSHDFMQGWIFIADHPYATVVDETGSFEITGIPLGTYELSAWHPRLGVSTQEINVVSDTENELDFIFSSE